MEPHRNSATAMGRPEVEGVLDAIYDAASEPHLWQKALEKIGDRFGGAPIVMGLQPVPQATTFAVCSRLDENLLRVFAERYSTPDTNPGIPYLIVRPAAQPFDFVRDYGANKFSRLDIYKDLYASQNIWLRCAATLFKEPGLAAPFGMMGRPGCETLTSDEIDELKFLFQHMARAMRVTDRIVRQAHEQQVARLALDCLESAVVLVAIDGKIVVMNKAAEEIIRAGDGLRVSAARLSADNSYDNAPLTRLIAAACSRAKRGGGSVGINRPSGSLRYGVEVVSLSIDPQSSVGAAIFINDPLRNGHNSVEQVSAILGLTNAEARIALKISEGIGLSEASDQLNISVNTLKTLLKRTFSKTGARRQSELVRLIASTIPNIRRS